MGGVVAMQRYHLFWRSLVVELRGGWPTHGGCLLLPRSLPSISCLLLSRPAQGDIHPHSTHAHSARLVTQSSRRAAQRGGLPTHVFARADCCRKERVAGHRSQLSSAFVPSGAVYVLPEASNSLRFVHKRRVTHFAPSTAEPSKPVNSVNQRSRTFLLFQKPPGPLSCSQAH